MFTTTKKIKKHKKREDHEKCILMTYTTDMRTKVEQAFPKKQRKKKNKLQAYNPIKLSRITKVNSYRIRPTTQRLSALAHVAKTANK